VGGYFETTVWWIRLRRYGFNIDTNDLVCCSKFLSYFNCPCAFTGAEIQYSAWTSDLPDMVATEEKLERIVLAI